MMAVVNVRQVCHRLLNSVSRIPTCNAIRNFFIYAPEPLHPLRDKVPDIKTAEEAVQAVESGQRVYLHGGAGTPKALIRALCSHASRNKLTNIEIIDAPTEGEALYCKPEFEGIFRANSLFVGNTTRKAVSEGRADCVPIFLSEIPLLFRRNILNLDVALISLSPPDNHGFCSLGPSVDCTKAAVQNAKYIIGLVNKQMPRSFGDGIIHMSHVNVLVETDEALPTVSMPKMSPEFNDIANLIADNLVEDGATLQTGIGTLPNVVLHKLSNHKDLGVHSEMFSDGIVDLVEKGAITNAMKTIQTGKIVSSFAVGSKRVYDFIDDNSFVSMLDCSFTNNIAIICQNPRVTAINTCLELDITGQVCSDSLGTYMYSGFGGQIDFIRGAALGLDGEGRPIITCKSTTEGLDGEVRSRIVPTLLPGAGVVVTRAHVHYIVTEYGIANLFGKNLRQRAYELINIAHPDFRDMLEKAAFERLKCMPSP